MAAQQAAYVGANAAGAVRSATPVATQSLQHAQVLPTAAKTKQLLPNGTHAFLSYQWDVQEQVIHIKELLNQRNVKCWMDIDGGMKTDIYDSMAEGVQGAAVVICFMTQAYQDSANCKLELKFAQQSGVPIIPVMMQANFSAKGWLGILTSGSIWTPMHDRASVPDGINKLIELAQHLVPGMHRVDDGSDAASEVNEGTESFDVGAWGADMFSLDEMREELERLREESDSGGRRSTTANEADSSLCSLPAMVPTLPHGLFVTAEMQTVLDAVLSDESPPQIGFCGMGGIGKTTVSCWVTRSDAVRTKFGVVAWITLGQTPALHACFDLLHLQLANTSMPEGVSFDQKHELLKQAFLHQSVLLILDDCWDEEAAKHFDWIDPSTNSKILISSRVREVLNGGQIINVSVPSQSDAVVMLLSTADLDVEALKGRAEVWKVADLCKRLPLTIGVAGKLIRQLAQGSSMASTTDWTDVLTLLEEELQETEGSMLSMEESIIRASIKAIPTKLRKNVSQLFVSFALAPEDMLVPLPVLGMLFNASNPSTSSSSSSDNGSEALSQMQIRRYLKVLIDRSLVLGTVDRPQLHDVMLEYAQKQLAGEVYKEAQRRLVELLRKSDRSAATPTGKYTQRCVRHHITESYAAAWEKSPQAVSWLEDHISGVQDAVASSAASILPAEALATEAEAAGLWWQAALRWNALGIQKSEEAGALVAGSEYNKKAANASAKVVVDHNSTADADSSSVTEVDLNMFDVHSLGHILKTWNPADTAVYGERYQKVLATEAGRSQPLLVYSAVMSLEWFPAIIRGDHQAFADLSWKLSKMICDLCDETTEAYSLATDEDRVMAKPLLGWTLESAGDVMMNTPGFSWDYLGRAGDVIIEHDNAYVFEVHHARFNELLGFDHFPSHGAPMILTLEYGRIEEARAMLDRNLLIAETCIAEQNIVTSMHLLCCAPEAFHIHGLSQHIQKVMELDGITFENADEVYVKRCESMVGTLLAPFERTEPGGGMISLKRIVWQLKVMLILHTDIPKPKAIAWLESLPDNDGFYATTMTFPTHDHLYALYRTCWLALAHEKFGLFDGALRFADLQLEPDMLKAGHPLTKWPQVIAWACKGRVLAKLGRQDEALAAFQAAIAVSKESYSLMTAFAYRELADFRSGGEAAVQASKDLEAKLDSFDGRLTRAAFDGLSIGPGEFKG